MADPNSAPWLANCKPCLTRQAESTSKQKQPGHDTRCELVQETFLPGIIVSDCMLQNKETFQQDRLVRGLSMHQDYVLVLLHLFFYQGGHLLLGEYEAAS